MMMMMMVMVLENYEEYDQLKRNAYRVLVGKPEGRCHLDIT
jgi:hypothetical protein